MKNTSLIILTILLSAFMIACDRNEAEITPEPVQTPVEEVTEPTEMTARIWIDDPTLGSQLAVDGSIDTGFTDNDFVAGDAIYYAMEVGDAPTNASVTVMWYGPGNVELHQETKNVEPGQTYLNFQAPDTTGWAVGDYRVEVHTEGELAHSEDFNIETA